jgi:pantoate--beta-alanine ligase
MTAESGAFRILRSVADLRAAVRDWRREGLSVALVPTMGALHDGHLHLVAEARKQADRVITSVFVNPTQFAAHEDLGAYPRQQARDAELLDAAGCAVMFAPTVEEMYAPGAVTKITVGDAVTGGPSQGLEGVARPQMFGGVALVVAKLLNQAQADVAVFGEKDWQQLMVVRRLAIDLDIPTRIVGAPTVRDETGLALSSRNAYLNPGELEIARRLNVILREAGEKARAGRPLPGVEREAYDAILKAGFDTIDYVVIRRADDLAPFPTGVIEGEARILTAARIGRTRLIDNMAV